MPLPSIPHGLSATLLAVALQFQPLVAADVERDVGQAVAAALTEASTATSGSLEKLSAAAGQLNATLATTAAPTCATLKPLMDTMASAYEEVGTGCGKAVVALKSTAPLLEAKRVAALGEGKARRLAGGAGLSPAQKSQRDEAKAALVRSELAEQRGDHYTAEVERMRADTLVSMVEAQVEAAAALDFDNSEEGGLWSQLALGMLGAEGELQVARASADASGAMMRDLSELYKNLSQIEAAMVALTAQGGTLDKLAGLRQQQSEVTGKIRGVTKSLTSSLKDATAKAKAARTAGSKAGTGTSSADIAARLAVIGG